MKYAKGLNELYMLLGTDFKLHANLRNY